MGSYQGAGEEKVGMEKQGEGEVSSNQTKRSFAVKEKDQQRKEKAAMAAQQRKKRAAINKIMDLDDKKEDEVAKQSEEVVKEHLIENQYEQSIGKYAGGDWTDWTEVNPNGLENTNLTMQQQLDKRLRFKLR